MAEYDKLFPADDEYLADFPPKQRENQQAIIESQIVDAGKLSGLKAGNASGNIPINNGTLNTNLNADKLDGKHATDFAAVGHVHNTATNKSAGFMSAAQVTKLESVAANAEVNQNAFSNVKVGSSTVQADNKTDTLEIAAGTNISITADTTNDKITIGLTGKVASAVQADKATTATTATSATKATQDKNGKDIAATYLPLTGGTVSGTLVLSKTTDLSGTANNSPALIVGGTATATHIELDNNEVQAKTSGTTTAQLNLNSDGGLVAVGRGGIKSQGNITAPKFIGALTGNADTATKATSATKATQDSDGKQINTTYAKSEEIGYWKAKEAVTVGTIRFLKGAKYAGYYLKCVQTGTTGSTQPTPAL